MTRGSRTASCICLAALLLGGGSALASEAPFPLAPRLVGEAPQVPLGEALSGPLPLTQPPVLGLAARRDDGDARAAHRPPELNAGRARILLRSLTVPGWGEATVGHRTSAGVFALIETGIWASFVSFRIQSQLRRESYERTARLFAGIDLRGRDEEFRRIVGAFISSDEYNQLVVFRDAANLYYNDPAAYRAYIAQHEIGGADSWSWSDVNALVRYRDQRKITQRASQRANTVLALAVVNRLLSAFHAARAAGHPEPPAGGRSWNFEMTPGSGNDATLFRVGVRTRF